MDVYSNDIYNKMKLSVFIPVYNGGKTLERNIKKVDSFLLKHFKEYELIIVDDNSDDDTQRVLENLKNKHIKSIRFLNGPSRRENLGEAMKTAKYPFVACMDADLSVPIKKLLDLVKGIEEGNDIVIGSRRIPNAIVERSLYRLWLSTLYHMTIHILFNSEIKDYQCGFKMFRKGPLFNLLKIIGYDKTKRRGWFWDAELLLTAEKQRYKIKEIPVPWKEGKNSSFSLIRELKTVYYIFLLRIKETI